MYLIGSRVLVHYNVKYSFYYVSSQEVMIRTRETETGDRFHSKYGVEDTNVDVSQKFLLGMHKTSNLWCCGI